MKNFKTFTHAVEFYHLARALPIKGPLRDQLARASASIALNLAEGRGRTGRKDQVRFFNIAMGSVRECQAILVLQGLNTSSAWNKLDCVAAHLYQLIKNAR